MDKNLHLPEKVSHLALFAVVAACVLFVLIPVARTLQELPYEYYMQSIMLGDGDSDGDGVPDRHDGSPYGKLHSAAPVAEEAEAGE